ncbi:eukaryotic translation initiation factor 4 gamma 3-like isoform X2 [Silurus meridionalis]|uniref:eukaryotic translation initiation factor 4 gamma 3-like isoform X2 n=1 Tax=Silurus meridionalis TaxID=175797 RepID=UPI001EEA59B3|nr:eukaryotic translation initiation factor 4 gamma 3-like isoform X2 [Silurus meridionalis]
MSTLPETKYWVTYVPVVVNMTASSPGEQMLYYYSAQVHVVPPQQFSVHLTGFNTCYTLLPEPTTPTNGMFYYNDQAVYNQTPFPMVPPLQQHPSTKRKRKTIVVRDPNQDNKDIMEEIISEAGRSRKPTLPVGNVFSVPMPLQLPADDKIYLGSNFGGRRLNWKNGCDGETSARATSGASVKLDAVPDSTTNKLRYQRRKWRNALNPLLRSFYT